MIGLIMYEHALILSLKDQLEILLVGADMRMAGTNG